MSAEDVSFERPTYGSFSATPPPAPAEEPRPRGSRWPWALAAFAIAFALGLLLSPWFETNVRGRLFGARPGSEIAAQTAAQARAIASLQARLGEVEALAQRAGAAGGADPERLDRLESRIDMARSDIGALGVRVTGAVTGAAQDAEAARALLLATRARRAVETGQPLGSLELPLRALFGERHPGAVEAIAAAGTRPVTLDRLRQDYARVLPGLAADPDAGTGWWARFRTALGGIVRVRREGDTRTDPAALAALASKRLDSGDVAGAVDLVRRLPGVRAATEWLSEARRYAAAQTALAAIEAEALTPPAPVRTPPVAASPVPSTRAL